MRVVAPVLNNPDQPVALAAMTAAALTFEVTAGPNLKGFETQYFDLLGKYDQVRLRLTKATLTVNGKTGQETHPLKEYFPLPAGKLYLRLVYLTRSNDAPHNMALIFTRRPAALTLLAASVSANPLACGAQSDACVWIPASVAVIAERRDPAGGADAWTPVQ